MESICSSQWDDQTLRSTTAKINQVIASNQALRSLPLATGLVTVFVGAGHDFELVILRCIARNENAPRIYVAETGYGQAQIHKFGDITKSLESINASGFYKHLGFPVKTTSEVDRICRDIGKTEAHVDVLILSTGFLRHLQQSCTDNESFHNLAHHQFLLRQRFISNLLPLLSQSHCPRILSILPPDHDSKLDVPHSSAHSQKPPEPALPSQEALETALLFTAYARRSPYISFISFYPGPLIIYSSLTKSVHQISWYPGKLLKWVAPSLFKHLMGICTEEIAEMVVHLATSVRYPPAKELRKEGKRAGWVEVYKGGDMGGVARAMVMKEGRGNGVYMIDEFGETCDGGELVERYLEELGEEALERYMNALKLVEEEELELEEDEEEEQEVEEEEETDKNVVEEDRHD
ncbi:hypothetical protein ACMFMG_006918 [Clarireedia jacksonii]